MDTHNAHKVVTYLRNLGVEVGLFGLIQVCANLAITLQIPSVSGCLILFRINCRGVQLQLVIIIIIFSSIKIGGLAG